MYNENQAVHISVSRQTIRHIKYLIDQSFIAQADWPPYKMIKIGKDQILININEVQIIIGN
jgi:predicted transcriptional regulator